MIKILFQNKPVAVILMLSMLSGSVSAQLKIYVNTDLEGISGVFKFSQTPAKRILL